MSQRQCISNARKNLLKKDIKHLKQLLTRKGSETEELEEQMFKGHETLQIVHKRSSEFSLYNRSDRHKKIESLDKEGSENEQLKANEFLDVRQSNSKGSLKEGHKHEDKSQQKLQHDLTYTEALYLLTHKKVDLNKIQMFVDRLQKEQKKDPPLGSSSIKDWKNKLNGQVIEKHATKLLNSHISKQWEQNSTNPQMLSKRIERINSYEKHHQLTNKFEIKQRMKTLSIEMGQSQANMNISKKDEEVQKFRKEFIERKREYDYWKEKYRKGGKCLQEELRAMVKGLEKRTLSLSDKSKTATTVENQNKNQEAFLTNISVVQEDKKPEGLNEKFLKGNEQSDVPQAFGKLSASQPLNLVTKTNQGDTIQFKNSINGGLLNDGSLQSNRGRNKLKQKIDIDSRIDSLIKVINEISSQEKKLQRIQALQCSAPKDNYCKGLSGDILNLKSKESELKILRKIYGFYAKKYAKVEYVKSFQQMSKKLTKLDMEGFMHFVKDFGLNKILSHGEMVRIFKEKVKSQREIQFQDFVEIFHDIFQAECEKQQISEECTPKNFDSYLKVEILNREKINSILRWKVGEGQKVNIKDKLRKSETDTNKVQSTVNKFSTINQALDGEKLSQKNIQGTSSSSTLNSRVKKSYRFKPSSHSGRFPEQIQEDLERSKKSPSQVPCMNPEFRRDSKFNLLSANKKRLKTNSEHIIGQNGSSRMSYFGRSDKLGSLNSSDFSVIPEVLPSKRIGGNFNKNEREDRNVKNFFKKKSAYRLNTEDGDNRSMISHNSKGGQKTPSYAERYWKNRGRMQTEQSSIQPTIKNRQIRDGYQENDARRQTEFSEKGESSLPKGFTEKLNSHAQQRHRNLVLLNEQENNEDFDEEIKQLEELIGKNSHQQQEDEYLAEHFLPKINKVEFRQRKRFMF